MLMLDVIAYVDRGNGQINAPVRRDNFLFIFLKHIKHLRRK